MQESRVETARRRRKHFATDVNVVELILGHATVRHEVRRVAIQRTKVSQLIPAPRRLAGKVSVPVGQLLLILFDVAHAALIAIERAAPMTFLFRLAFVRTTPTQHRH